MSRHSGCLHGAHVCCQTYIYLASCNIGFQMRHLAGVQSLRMRGQHLLQLSCWSLCLTPGSIRCSFQALDLMHQQHLMTRWWSECCDF